jgi:hypothetical protein
MKRNTSALTVLAAMVAIVGLVFAVPAFAAKPGGGDDDAVLSQHVKEADGTTGQDTNAGSGVKTGHIQDGAVTDAKIAGPISSSKIQSTGLDADTLDGQHAYAFANATHNHDSVYQKKYANVVVVAASGGDFTDLASAMSSITNATASNPYLIKIMPGEYQMTSDINAKDYVDVEGSGVTVTKLLSSGAQVHIDGGITSELRNFTLEGNFTGVSGSNELIRTLHSSPQLKDLNMRVLVDSSTGIVSGIRLIQSNLLMSDVKLEILSQSGLASGADGVVGQGSVDGSGTIMLNNVSVSVSGAEYSSGISIDYGTAVLNNVDVQVSDGFENWGIISGGVSGPQYNPKVTVKNSEVSAMIALSVSRVFDSGELLVVNTKVEGTTENTNATLKLVNCYDGNYDPIPDGSY